MREELERFVASLAIPADRKTVVLAELLDHASCAREAATREGGDPDAAERAAIGNLEALRRSLEAVEPAFRITRRHALARGIVGGMVVALLLDQGGALMTGVLGAVVAIAVAAVCAPPRLVELLRAELRAPRIRHSVPIGPAITYCYAILSTPFVVWIAMIVTRAFGGMTTVDVPVSAFAVMVAVLSLLLIEGIRARRPAAT